MFQAIIRISGHLQVLQTVIKCYMPSSSIPGHPHNQKEKPGYLAKYVNF
jgi:hypothetical protein